MSVPDAPAPQAIRSAWSWRGLGVSSDSVSVTFGVIALSAAAVAGYELVHGSERLAIAFSLVPLAVWLLTHPTVPLVLFGLSIPVVVSLSGSAENSTSGYKVAASDILLILVTAGILIERTVVRPVPVVRALRPVSWPVMQYAAVMLFLVSFHHSAHDLLKTGQRFELFLLPLVVGAFAAYTGWHVRTLGAYVVACTVLAFVFPFDSFGMQHNPVGQFIANAILLLVGVRALRRLFPCFFILVPGLILTESRGAIIAGAIGVMIIVSLQQSGSRPVMRRIVPFVLLALAAFALAPASLEQRLTTLSPGTQSSSQYSIYLREQQARNAEQIIRAHPLTGVGIGNYYSADAAITNAPVLDPNNVILLQAAEGGYVLAASFVLLIVGVVFALSRMRRVDVGAAAAGVLIATVAHGLVDIYWVRGTPLLGWLLVGMACGGLARLREQPTTAT